RDRCCGNGGKYWIELCTYSENGQSRSSGKYAGDRSAACDALCRGSERFFVWKRDYRSAETRGPHPARFWRAALSERERAVKLAIVVQRYGEGVAGGAERHCRLLAERFIANHDVTVLTTCAIDYRTW